MLLGHTAFAEQAFQDARLDAVHNIEFTEAGNVSSYEATFSIGTEVATGGATIAASGDDLQFTASVGDETAFGEAFQNLISFSVGSPDFFLWNEVDDAHSATWKDVDPGSTD